MKRIPKKAANIKKKGYKRLAGSYDWDLAVVCFGKRIRVNGKEIKDEGNLEKYC